MFDGYGNMTIL